MPNVRVSLSSIGYHSNLIPGYQSNPIPNSLFVLQSLYKEGFTISLLNGKRYKDKYEISEWFYDRGLHVKFIDVSKPDIEVNNTFVRVLGEKSDFDLVNGWENLDKLLVNKGVYERDNNSYIPSYKKDSYFLVMNYGDKDQFIDSKPRSLDRSHRFCKTINSHKEVRTIHIINSTTLEAVEFFDFSTGKFEALEPDVYFSVLV